MPWSIAFGRQPRFQRATQLRPGALAVACNTPREKFIAALERRPITGRVPHFELVFFLTMEAFGAFIRTTEITASGCR